MSFNILVLDGGGSKGIYTIGVLKELERKLGGLLFEHFNLIYGTSTGSIISALVALGHSVYEIEKLYLKHIPEIMSARSSDKKSEHLKALADKIFGDKMFGSFKTDIGIVSLNYDEQKPLIFKSNIKQAHGMKQSFDPGFGCSISNAVQSSCSAYPIFAIKKISTTSQGEINAIDGGFIANNATLYALIDAHKAYKINENEIRLLNIGTGKFIEKPLNWKFKILKKVNILKFIERILISNTATNVELSKLLFPNVKTLRICETYTEPEYETNMIEMDINKLKKIAQLGRKSYAKFEMDVLKLFELET